MNVHNVLLTDLQLTVSVIVDILKLMELVINVLTDVLLVTLLLTIVSLVLVIESILVLVNVTMVIMMMVPTSNVHLVDIDVPDVPTLNITVPFVPKEDLVSQIVNVTTVPPKLPENVSLVELVVTVVNTVNQPPVKIVSLHMSMLQYVTVHLVLSHSLTDVTNVNTNVSNVPVMLEIVTLVEETEPVITVNVHPVIMKPSKNNAHHVTNSVKLVPMPILNVLNVLKIPTELLHQLVTVPMDFTNKVNKPFVLFVMKNVLLVLMLLKIVSLVPET